MMNLVPFAPLVGLRPSGRRLREIAVAGLCLLAVGAIPGARLRSDPSGAHAPPSLAAEGAVPLDVVVHDGVDGPGLPGARVVAFAIVDGQAYRAGMESTGPDGRVTLPRVPAGEVWILVDAPGRVRGSSHLVLDANRRSLAIHLGAEHVVVVDARDELGAPVSAAEVEVTSTGSELGVGARTGADGRARVGRLGPGPWSVTVRAVGYEEGFARVEHDGDSAVLVVRRLGSFEVQVVAENGQPAAGAHVSLAGALLWPPRSADTDGGGEVRVGGLAAGVYALRATRGDGVSPIEVGLALERGEDRSVQLRLAAGRWVAVRVVEDAADSGLGIASARVSLAEGGLSPFPIEATTDSKGRARLGPIAVGSAALSARADGFVSRGGLPLPEPLSAEMTVPLVRAGTLTGRVVDERGQPVDGATVEVVGTDPSGAPIFDDPRRASFQAANFDALLAGPAPLIADGQLGVMPGPVPPIPAAGAWVAPHTMATPTAAEPWVTRGDGMFRASPASPGRVRAVVRHPQYIEAESESVTLSPGGEAHVLVVMRQGGVLEGRVVDAQQRPVGGVRIRAAAVQGAVERTTRTASDGTFAFAALPDEVSLTAEQDGDDQPGLRVSVSVPEGGRKEITLQLPEARGPLSVRVVDDRGFPIESAEIRAVATAPEVSLRTTAFTDANGEATLRRAGGVALRIDASAPGHAPRVITADGSAGPLRIVLAAGETIGGRVVAAQNGQAIQDAQVTLSMELGVRRARTDAEGNYTLSELGAGSAKINVRAAHFASATRSIDVPDSAGRRTFDVPAIELPEEGIVEGEVVDGRGEPVSGARVARDHVPTWMLGASNGEGMAVTDSRGQFVLGELGEGQVALEAYSADFGRGRLEGVAVGSGRTTYGARIVIVPEANGESSGGASEGKQGSVAGSVAVTLGETSAPVQVVVVSVAPGSEAERGGLLPGDVILAIDGQPVDSMSGARQRLDGPLSDDVAVHLQRGGRDLSVRVTREPVHR